MKKLRMLYAGLVLVGLMYLWPNFVHESLHSVAAFFQGVHVEVVYDFVHVPSQPVVQWTGQFTSLFGWYVFLLLPSVVAIGLLIALLFTPAFIESHVSLPIYLCIESVMNVLKYDSAISDWRVLDSLAWGHGFSIVIASIIVLLTCAVVARALHIIKLKKELGVVSLGKKLTKKRKGRMLCIVCRGWHNGQPHFPNNLGLSDVIVHSISDVEDIEKELEARYYGG